MKLKHLSILTIGCQLLAYSYSDAQINCGSWLSVGPSDTNQIEFGGGTGSTYNGIAVNPVTNNPYVVFRDADAPNYYGTSVRQYIGGQWMQVGNPGFTAGEGKYNAIAFGKNGTPYVASSDQGRGNHCSVFTLVGGVWDTVGPLTADFTHASQFDAIATDSSGAPWVAYENIINDRLEVLRYDDTANVWKPVGDTIVVSPGQAQYTCIAFDKGNNIPYVAFEDGKHHDRLMVYSFNGTTWNTVGGTADTAGITTDTVNWVSLTVDQLGNPYVSYEDFSSGQNLGVMMFNGTNWVADTASRTANLGGPVNYTSIGVDSIDNVYVSYQDLSYYGDEKLSIAEFSGGTWNYAGGNYKYSQAISQGDGVYTSLAMNNNGIPVVTYNDKGIGHHCEAFQWNSVTKYWTYLGSEGISNGSGSDWNGLASYLSLAVSPTTNEPYVIYKDGNNDEKATVMNWNGTTWNVVGTPGISSSTVKFTTIGFDRAGEPIACFSDKGASPSYGVSVMKYSGGTWSAVGANAASISGKDAYYVSMAVSASDTIYVTYQDYTPEGINVMKCAVNGTTWQLVGSADFSGDTASDESIAIDRNGMPYVSFIDNKDTDGVTVMNYSGGLWNVVGVRGFSGGGCNYTAIQINPSNNLPAVSYDNWDASNEADVEQFNGTSWQFVGGAGISHDWASYTALFIDKNGNYYTSYQDFGNEVSTEGYGNATVEVFPAGGPSWIYAPFSPSDGSCSYGGGISETIAVDSTGTIYAGFIGYSAYVKQMNCPEIFDAVKNITPASMGANVYPNPSHGLFTVQLSDAGTQNVVSAEVYNMIGEKIYSQSNIQPSIFNINLTSQPEGIYLYRILNEKGQVVSTGKLIIQ